MPDESITKRFDVDRHDEIGYRLGAVAVSLIEKGYDPTVVANRLRANADRIEKTAVNTGDSSYNE
jgi:hypothetical protein